MTRKMKDSGVEWIGMIPDGWNTFSAFQIFSRVDCKNVGVKERNLLSLSYGRIKRKDIESADGLLPESFEGYNIIEAGDIVLRLTDLQNDQKSLRVGYSRERGIVTSAYLTIRNNSDNVPEYLYYYWHTFDICKGFYGLGAGVRQGLNWEGLKNLRIALPLPSVQNKIVELLNKQCATIDDVIAKTTESIEEYKKLKQAVITEAVTKGVRGKRPMKDSDIDWIGQIPKEWSVLKSRYVIDNLGDVDHYMPQSVDEGVPYVMTGDLKDYVSQIEFDACKQISQDDYIELSKKTKAVQGDVIFARYATIGTVSYVDVERDFIISYSCLTVHPNVQKIDGKYLFYYFKSMAFLEDVKQYVNTNIQGNVGIESLYKAKCIVPNTLDEQREIAEYLDSKCAAIDTLISKKQQFIDELTDYKKSLIYEFVTGKKEVPA